jgi:ribosomal protein S12 methylthiotransferase accessory factor YcaO
MEGYNSVHINIPNTNMFTNGKGINYELTLASGYVEFMERLQNQYLYKYQIDFSNDVESYRDFYFAPDEKYFSTEDILHNSDSESIYIPPIAKKSLSYDFITKWKSFI